MIYIHIYIVFIILNMRIYKYIDMNDLDYFYSLLLHHEYLYDDDNYVVIAFGARQD